MKEKSREDKNSSKDEKHPDIHISLDFSVNGNDKTDIRIDLSELKTFTIKKLDSLLDKYNIPKHGNKDRKIEKLKNYVENNIWK